MSITRYCTYLMMKAGFDLILMQDDSFVIAKQKPKLPPDPLYTRVYKYEKNDPEFYYWLIRKNEDVILGPYQFEEFNDVRSRYKVPTNLKLI